MIAFDEACRRVAGIARSIGVEFTPLDQAWGRVLAAPVIAPRAAPEAATSAMDGYAVRDCDVSDGTARLHVVGETFAGQKAFERPLEPGACVRIFTGARLPPGADRVIMQEAVRREADDILLTERPTPARHVRAPGSDFQRGESLLDAGVRLTPQALVAAAAADRETLRVYTRPRVAIISTGDELVAPGQAGDRRGAIPESVSFGVAALARSWGGDIAGRQRLKDDLSVLIEGAREALDDAHVVVVTGGASVGERDFAKAMFEPLGLKLLFEKVAMKPGKPIWVGQVGEQVVVGLPGNPSAAMVTARLFLAPLLAGMTGRRPDEALAWRTAPLSAPLSTCGERDCFQRACSSSGGVRPLVNQDASAQKELAAADLLIRRRPGARALYAGDLAEVLTF